MADDRINIFPSEQFIRLAGRSTQQAFKAGLALCSLAARQSGRIASGAVASGNRVQSGLLRGMRDPLGAAGAVASAVSLGAMTVLHTLGRVAEPRMTRALNALQIPTAHDVQGLARRVEQLNATVQQLTATRDAAAHAKPGRKRAAARKKTAAARRRANTQA